MTQFPLSVCNLVLTDTFHVCDSISTFVMRHNYVFLLGGVCLLLYVVSGGHLLSFITGSPSLLFFLH